MAKKQSKKFKDLMPMEAIADLMGVTPQEALGKPEESKAAKKDRLSASTHYLMNQEASFLHAMALVIQNYLDWIEPKHDDSLVKDMKNKKDLLEKRAGLFERNRKNAREKKDDF